MSQPVSECLLIVHLEPNQPWCLRASVPAASADWAGARPDGGLRALAPLPYAGWLEAASLLGLPALRSLSLGPLVGLSIVLTALLCWSQIQKKYIYIYIYI